MAAPRRWTTDALTGGRPSRRQTDRPHIGVLWTELALRAVLAIVWVAALWVAAPTATAASWLLAGVVWLVYLPVTAVLARRSFAGVAAVPHLFVLAADLALGAAGAALVPEWRVPVLFLFLALVVTTTLSAGGRRGLAVSGMTTTAAVALSLGAGPPDAVTMVALVPFVACAFALPVLISQLASGHRRHAEHLSRLHVALASIAATPDLAGTFDVVSGTARAAVGASSVTLLTADDTGPGELAVPSPPELAARTARPVVVADPASDVRFGSWGRDAAAEGVTAVVSVPLRTGDHVIGALNAYWTGGGPTREDVDLLSAYAEGASLSILRAQAFEQERRAAAALRAAERDRAEFTASIAHELRTPLTTVRGFIETMLLREDLLDATDRRQMLEISRRNAVDLTHRISSLLEHSKLEGDHVTVDPHVQPLGPALAVALDNCNGLLAAHRLVVEVPDGLLVELDEIALDHIVANLISNAVKYAAEGTSITVRATVSDDETVVVSVEDRGIGIPPDDLPRVFDRFYRGGDQGRRSGTGIGLAIVKRYVELAGGDIWVESVAGEGATFRFTLPFAGVGQGFGRTVDITGAEALVAPPGRAAID